MIRFCLFLFVSLTGLVASGSPQSARALFDDAESAFAEGNFPRAIQLAQEARDRLGSTNPRIEGLLAQALFEANHPAGARIALDRLFQLVPESDRSRVRSNYHHLSEQIDESLEREQRAATRGERELRKRLMESDADKRQPAPGRDAAAFAALLQDEADVSTLLAFHRAFPESEEGKRAAENARSIADRQERALRERFAETLTFAAASFLDREAENPLFAVPSDSGYRYLPVRDTEAGIPRFYEDARQFSHGLAATRVDGKWGFIDGRGEVRIPHLYEAVLQPFNGFVTQVVVDEEPVFVDADGRELPGLQPFQRVTFLSGGIAQAANANGESCLISWQGEHLFDEAGYQCLDFVELENGWRYAVEDPRGRLGVIDANGCVLIPFRYEQILLEDFKRASPAIRVRLDRKWGAVAPSAGEPVVPLQYEQLLPFQEGMAAFLQNGRWGFIDDHGKPILPARFDSVPFGSADLYGAGELSFLPDGSNHRTRGAVYALVLQDKQTLLVDPSASIHPPEELLNGAYGPDTAVAAHHAVERLRYLVPPSDDNPEAHAVIGTWDFFVERQIEEPRTLRKLVRQEFVHLRDQIFTPVSVALYARGSIRFHPDGRFELAQRLSAELLGGPQEGGEVQFIHRRSGSYSLINNRILPITVTSQIEAANPAAEQALRMAPELRQQLTNPVPLDAEVLELGGSGEPVKTLTDPDSGNTFTLHRRDELLAQP